MRLRGVPLMLLMMIASGLAAFVPTTFIAPLSFHSAAVDFELLPLVCWRMALEQLPPRTWAAGLATHWELAGP